MSKIAIRLPTFIIPKTNSEDCDCLKKPLETTYKAGRIFWQKEVGEKISLNDIICDVEIEKRTYEVVAETEGILVEQLIPDGETFEAQSVLGYLIKD